VVVVVVVVVLLAVVSQLISQDVLVHVEEAIPRAGLLAPTSLQEFGLEVVVLLAEADAATVEGGVAAPLRTGAVDVVLLTTFGKKVAVVT